jgi:flagellar basal-body rod protein FlgB
MEDVTVSVISMALDAAIMRQTAIASNVANTNAEGMQTITVNFEQQLKDVDRHLDKNDLNQVAPFYEINQSKPSLDEQMALSVSNATHFRALIKGLNHKLGLMQLALQGNNQS